MSKLSPRNGLIRKKKAATRMARPKLTRNQGNTAGIRKRLRKEAGKARSAAPHAPAEAS